MKPPKPVRGKDGPDIASRLIEAHGSAVLAFQHCCLLEQEAARGHLRGVSLFDVLDARKILYEEMKGECGPKSPEDTLAAYAGKVRTAFTFTVVGSRKTKKPSPEFRPPNPDEMCCFWCLEPMFGRRRTIEHLIPRRHGERELSPTVYACYECNTGWSTIYPLDAVTVAKRLHVFFGEEQGFSIAVGALGASKTRYATQFWSKVVGAYELAPSPVYRPRQAL